MGGRFGVVLAVAVIAIASGCGGSGAKSTPKATASVGASNTTTTVCRAAGSTSGGTSTTVCGAGGAATASTAPTRTIKLRLTVDGTYKGQAVKGAVIPGSLHCASITTGGKQGLQVTWGGTINGTGQVSGDMMFAGGVTSITFGDNKSQGEASLVIKGDYQDRYGASSALGSGTEDAKAGYSGGTIDAQLDGGSAGAAHLQGSWDC